MKKKPTKKSAEALEHRQMVEDILSGDTPQAARWRWLKSKFDKAAQGGEDE